MWVLADTEAVPGRGQFSRELGSHPHEADAAEQRASGEPGQKSQGWGKAPHRLDPRVTKGDLGLSPEPPRSSSQKLAKLEGD